MIWPLVHKALSFSAEFETEIFLPDSVNIPPAILTTILQGDVK